MHIHIQVNPAIQSIDMDMVTGHHIGETKTVLQSIQAMIKLVNGMMFPAIPLIIYMDLFVKQVCIKDCTFVLVIKGSIFLKILV